MALKKFKPNTPGLRQRTVLVRSEITAQKPEKSLTVSLNKKAGRDTFGRISVRRRGGGHKRAYRIIDFKRDKYGVPGIVKTIEYDQQEVSLSVYHNVTSDLSKGSYLVEVFVDNYRLASRSFAMNR